MLSDLHGSWTAFLPICPRRYTWFRDMGFVIILQRFLDVLRIAGAFLLILLGASTLRGVTKGVDIGVREIVGTPYARGFSLTFLNVPFILWLMTVGLLCSKLVRTLGNMAYIIFDINLLGGSPVVTLAIIFSAHFGKRVISARGIRTLSLVSGTSFIVMAIVIIVPILDRLR